MFDLIFTGTFVLVTLLLLVAMLREWRITKRNADVLPAIAFLFAALAFIADLRVMGMPWLAGFIWILIGVVVRVVVHQRVRKQP